MIVKVITTHGIVFTGYATKVSVTKRGSFAQMSNGSWYAVYQFITGE